MSGNSGTPSRSAKPGFSVLFIIALDGPPAASWLPFERSELLAPTDWSDTDASWVVYVPSAAALTAPQWTLPATLQAWYRLGLRQAIDPRVWATDPRALPKAGAGPPIDGESILIYQLALEPGRTSSAMFLRGFLTDKRRQDLPAIALCVNRGTRR